MPRDRLAKLSRSAGESLVAIRTDTLARQDLVTVRARDVHQLQALANRLQGDPSVEYAVVDRRRRAHAIPSDPLVNNQWYLLDAQPAAIRANTAWDITQGSANVVVAVLDTGVRFEHPDLLAAAQGGKLLPGYDFVAGALTANDGDGRDADATDPGDWISQGDLNRPDNFFDECGGGPNGDLETGSSWHGTRVAGMIGARTNNIEGIAGAGWNTMILPVRVLGKCGGYDSDILDGMRWAAGLPVSGVDVNPNPARVINLSLGGEGTCSAAYQSLIQQLSSMGVVVVISAGNEGGPVSEPANCPGAVAVAGIRHVGTKVGFSNLGPQIAIAAPGGNCVNITPGSPCLFELTTTINTGFQAPQVNGSGYSDQLSIVNLGTSFSAPIVSGVAALMAAVNGNLSADKIRARLREGATPFPAGDPGVPVCHVPTSSNDIQATECECTTSTCGAGMLNAEGAVRAALRPIARISSPSIVAGASVTFDGAMSTASLGRSVTGFSWSASTTCDSSAPSLTVTNQSNLIVNAPTVGSFGLRLTVTDNIGATDSTYVLVSTNSATASDTPPTCPAPPSPQPPPSSGGGGGGSSDLRWVIALALLWIARRRYAGKSRVN